MSVKFIKPRRKVTKVYLHCSASDHPNHDNAATMDAWHKARGWSGIGYNFFIRKSGLIEIGRDINKIPAAQAGHNRGSIAICSHGLAIEKFTEEQFNSLRDISGQIDDAYNSRITFHGHCEVSAKACPVFDYKAVLQLDKHGHLGASTVSHQEPVKVVDGQWPELKSGAKGPAVERLQQLLNIKVDGAFGPKTARAVRAFKKSHGLFDSDVVAGHVWKLLENKGASS